jgi:hypothetical protein
MEGICMNNKLYKFWLLNTEDKKCFNESFALCIWLLKVKMLILQPICVNCENNN